MKAIITVGCSASGKSSWTESFLKNLRRKNYEAYLKQNHPDEAIRDAMSGAADTYTYDINWVEVNRDDIRFNNFCGGVRDWKLYKWKNESKVSGIAQEQRKAAYELGQNIIISDTNLNEMYRNILIKELKDNGYEVEIKKFDVDLEELYRRDKLRPNSVGYDVIYKQWLQWLDYKGEKKYEPDVTLKQCVCVDVDGTVASMKGVRGAFDWNKVHLDNPISTVMDIVDGLYKRGYSIVFLSGRDGVCYDITKNWLEEYFKFPIELYMRAAGDMRKDYIVKRELFFDNVVDNYYCKMVVDDRSQVLERLWTPLGIKTINVGNTNERF